MEKKEVETLPEKPVIKTGLSTAIEKLFNEKISQEFQKITNEVPENIDSPEAALQMADVALDKIWHKEISPILDNLFGVWEKTFVDNQSEAHLKKIFANPEKLEQSIKIMYFSELLELKEILPEVWDSLVRISMLHQQWKMKLIAIWLEEIPEEKFKDSGIDKAQFEIALEVTNELGPLFGQIYLMQMNDDYQHLLPNKIRKKNNSSYSLYAVVDEETGKRKNLPPKKVFPETIPQIIIKCNQIAQKTLEKYPEEGKQFANYLKKIALFLNPKTIGEDTENWEELAVLEEELEKSDWPIAMVATHQPYITGPIEKTDFDLLVGLKTKRTKESEAEYSNFAEIAKKIAAEYDQTAEKSIIPAEIYFLLFGVGANNFWRNQGSADKKANCYENSILDVSRAKVLPFHQKIFQPENLNHQADEEFNKLAVISTIIHELGHTILSLYREKFSNRLGNDEKHSEMIEEIKADTTGIRIFWESKPNLEQAKKMLEYIVSYYASYAESSRQGNSESLEKKGEFNSDKEMAGIVISALLDAGSLVKTSNGYKIENIQAGFESICEISNKILKRYNNKRSTPEKFSVFAKDIEKRNQEHSGFQEFMKFITSQI